MKITRRTETKVKMAMVEFLEALGIENEGYVQKISHEWVADYHRAGAGATVVTIEMVQHDNDYRRKARPRRKK